MFQATSTATPVAYKEQREPKKQLGVTLIKKKKISVMSVGSYYTHTYTAGQGTSLEHTKRSFIAFKGSLNQCKVACQAVFLEAFTLCGLIRL